MFHDARKFSFAGPLQSHWREIHREYLGVRHLLIDWFERKLYGEGWKVFGLFDFPHGAAIPDNMRRCPLTVSLIERHVPRHGAAGFSVLQPGTRIAPHTGYAGNFLRGHLGLSVPAGDCGLRVGDQTRNWEEGRLLILDDRIDHAAWNLASEERVVLLFDFVPDETLAPESTSCHE